MWQLVGQKSLLCRGETLVFACLNVGQALFFKTRENWEQRGISVRYSKYLCEYQQELIGFSYVNHLNLYYCTQNNNIVLLQPAWF